MSRVFIDSDTLRKLHVLKRLTGKQSMSNSDFIKYIINKTYNDVIAKALYESGGAYG